MYDINIINAIDTVIGWDLDAALTCVRSLAEIRYQD
jgi:hypothetical protein